MVKRSNHYEAAFEAYLRDHGIPYVAVDEARRTVILPDTPSHDTARGGSTAQTQVTAPAAATTLKSLDFIVSPPGAMRLLVDVKGRRFPSGQRNPQYWRNWTTNDEVRSLAHWEDIFGDGFLAVLVFAYHVTGGLAPLPEEELFQHGGELYGFVAVRLSDYISFARPLSARWDTVTMPRAQFRAYGSGFSSFMQKVS